MSDWKQHHADEASRVLHHELVKSAMQEFAANMGFDLDGLPAYGLAKIATHAAQVARAQALGFDPDLLRLDPDEANSQMIRMAADAIYRGVPTYVIDDGQTPADAYEYLDLLPRIQKRDHSHTDRESNDA